MGLKTTRKILVIVLAIVIAFSTASAVSVVVTMMTTSKQSFYVNAIATDELAQECENQLSQKYDALSKKTNIPAEVFNSVTKQYNTKSSLGQAVAYIFDENDSTLNNDTRIKYFNQICVQYLDANDISYTQEELDNVCNEATQIYSDTVGIHNLDYIKTTVTETKNSTARVLSLYVVLTVFALVAIILLYRKHIEGLPYIAYGVMAGGVTQIISSVLALIFKWNTTYEITPQIYSNVFNGIAKTVLLYQLIGGLLLLILGIVIFVVAYLLLKKEKFRKDTRFFKVVDKL